jgi:hypothetical protein
MLRANEIHTKILLKLDFTAYPIFLAESGGAPAPFFFFSFNATFLLGHTGLYETEQPSPKKLTFFCFWNWKDGTSTVAILLQGYPWPIPPERCCLHPQAVAEPA